MKINRLRIIAEHLGPDGWHISYLDENNVYTYPEEQKLEFVHVADHEALKADRAMLVEALEFYADSSKMYDDCYDVGGEYVGFMPNYDDFGTVDEWKTLNHFGKRARQALTKLKGEGEL